MLVAQFTSVTAANCEKFRKLLNGYFCRTCLCPERRNADNGNRAAKLIQNALGIESDDVANYCFPKTWPQDREQRARIIGETLSVPGLKCLPRFTLLARVCV